MKVTNKCGKCKINKDPEDFHKNKNRKNQRDWICKKCSKEKNASRKERTREVDYINSYGITISDYENILNNQGRVCLICKADSPNGKGNHFHIDHCHKTQNIRGLLCHNCNTSLGGFKDSVEVLQSAIKYLNTDFSLIYKNIGINRSFKVEKKKGMVKIPKSGAIGVRLVQRKNRSPVYNVYLCETYIGHGKTLKEAKEVYKKAYLEKYGVDPYEGT